MSEPIRLPIRDLSHGNKCPYFVGIDADAARRIVALAFRDSGTKPALPPASTDAGPTSAPLQTPAPAPVAPVAPVAQGDAAQIIPSRDDPLTWIVNDSGELGVLLDGHAYFLYKAGSIEYLDGKHDDGRVMRYRRVGKREFGECCHPYKMDGLTARQYFDGVGAGGEWFDLPAHTKPVTPPAPAPVAQGLLPVPEIEQEFQANLRDWRGEAPVAQGDDAAVR